jgi:hypothetical protein
MRQDLRRAWRQHDKSLKPRIFKAEGKADDKKGKPSLTKQLVHMGFLREYRRGCCMIEPIQIVADGT